MRSSLGPRSWNAGRAAEAFSNDLNWSAKAGDNRRLHYLGDLADLNPAAGRPLQLSRRSTTERHRVPQNSHSPQSPTPVHVPDCPQPKVLHDSHSSGSHVAAPLLIDSFITSDSRSPARDEGPPPAASVHRSRTYLSK